MPTFREKCKSAFKDFIHNQTVDWATVQPRQNFAKGRFFLVSPAGIIVYKVKSEADISRFRDRWISTFDQISKIPDAKIRANAFHQLYRQIRQGERVSWKANLHTRWISYQLS